MTTTVETPPAPEASREEEQENNNEINITERRAALEKKFGGFASKANMSDEDVNKWFDSISDNEKLLEALYADEKPTEEDKSEEVSEPEKRRGLRRLLPKAPEGIPTMEEMQAYQDSAAENIAEAKRAYEAKRENIGKVNIVGRINNAYIMGVLKRADKRAAKDAKYAQKRERREGESAEAYAKRLKWYDRRSRAVVGLGVATGAALYLGSRGMHDYQWIHDQVTGGDSPDIALAVAHEDKKESTPAGAGQFRNAELVADQARIDGFKYDRAQDPFYMPGKQGVHDFGAPLQSNTLDGNKPAGWNDWTQVRLTNSPEQLASIATGMGVDGQTDANMNPLAEQFKDAANGPKLMSHYHEEVMKILNDPTTKIREEAITGPYASLYEWDQNGDGVLARDDYVDERGTKMIIEFGPPNNRQVMEIRKDCGGQRIWAPVIPVQEVVSRPQGNGSYNLVSNSRPQGNGSYTPRGGGNPPVNNPPAENPPTNNPPTNNPPTNNPPTNNPPTEQPPVAKEPTKDVNVNPGLPEAIRMGAERMGSGLLQSLGQVTAPPAQYDNPIGTMGTRPASPGSVAPGANASPESLGQHNQAPPAQVGSTGNASTNNHETTRVSE